jgi:hypothetical protein
MIIARDETGRRSHAATLGPADRLGLAAAPAFTPLGAAPTRPGDSAARAQHISRAGFSGFSDAGYPVSSRLAPEF